MWGALGVVLLMAGCFETDDGDEVCDQLCQAQNGDTAATQTSYWSTPRLLGGADIAWFGDGTGKVRITGTPPFCLCPVGAACNAPSFEVATFGFTETGDGTLLVADGGVTFTCNAPLTGSSSITSFSGLSGGLATASLEFYVVQSRHIATLVSGSF
jgi:hypothetical protein